jgi:hypothetical protein
MIKWWWLIVEFVVLFFGFVFIFVSPKEFFSKDFWVSRKNRKHE